MNRDWFLDNDMSTVYVINYVSIHPCQYDVSTVRIRLLQTSNIFQTIHQHLQEHEYLVHITSGYVLQCPNDYKRRPVLLKRYLQLNQIPHEPHSDNNARVETVYFILQIKIPFNLWYRYDAETVLNGFDVFGTGWRRDRVRLGRRRGARAAAGSHDNAAIDVMRTRSSAPLFTHLTIPLW